MCLVIPVLVSRLSLKYLQDRLFVRSAASRKIGSGLSIHLARKVPSSLRKADVQLRIGGVIRLTKSGPRICGARLVTLHVLELIDQIQRLARGEEIGLHLGKTVLDDARFLGRRYLHGPGGEERQGIGERRGAAFPLT